MNDSVLVIKIGGLNDPSRLDALDTRNAIQADLTASGLGISGAGMALEDMEIQIDAHPNMQAVVDKTMQKFGINKIYYKLEASEPMDLSQLDAIIMIDMTTPKKPN
jgi:hypothetical protein